LLSKQNEEIWELSLTMETTSLTTNMTCTLYKTYLLPGAKFCGPYASTAFTESSLRTVEFGPELFLFHRQLLHL